MKPRPSLLLVTGALLCGVLLSGCWTVSYHPLFTDDTLVFDERLLGTWKGAKETAVFTRQGEKKYHLRHTVEESTSDLEACLVKLGEERYLDVYSPPKDDFDEATEAHHIPAHSFWKISLEGNQMRLTLLDFDWLRDLLEKDPKAISAVRVDKDLILLTASSAELQQFVRRHSEQAFKTEEGNVWRRVPAPKKD